MMKNIVIIPTYNEIENVEDMIRTVMGLDFDVDVLVVDDNSPDGTAQCVQSLQKEFNNVFLESRQEKNGLGTAYIHGFKWCLAKGYDYIFEMDCDFSHNPIDLERLWDACQNGKGDVAVGSRYVDHLVNVVNWPMGRVLLSYFASMYVRFITRMKIMDTTAGFVCYSSEVLQSINLDKIRFRGYAFQIEMKFTAIKHGFTISEVPIIFTDRTKGTSKMSKGIVKEALFGVIQMKIQSWFKKY
ncbi:MAG: polyprenol monophosphomannose synthase [Bacteroidetes bacterium]|nr:polyprenol monophosphomannose synthase [Bacteroidota bacterium]